MSVLPQERRIPFREQNETAEEHPTRVTVALEEGKPIGLELDFSPEVCVCMSVCVLARIEAQRAKRPLTSMG